jgi:hypothetical protein
MPITVSTLNNDSAVAKTFTEIGKDLTNAVYINTTDSTATKSIKLQIRQQVIGKTKTGVAIRRSNVQVTATAVDDSASSPENVIVNLTITGPENLTVLGSSDAQDAMAYVRNLCTGANVTALRQGQV